MLKKADTGKSSEINPKRMNLQKDVGGKVPGTPGQALAKRIIVPLNGSSLRYCTGYFFKIIFST